MVYKFMVVWVVGVYGVLIEYQIQLVGLYFDGIVVIDRSFLFVIFVLIQFWEIYFEGIVKWIFFCYVYVFKS